MRWATRSYSASEIAEAFEAREAFGVRRSRGVREEIDDSREFDDLDDLADFAESTVRGDVPHPTKIRPAISNAIRRFMLSSGALIGFEVVDTGHRSLGHGLAKEREHSPDHRSASAPRSSSSKNC